MSEKGVLEHRFDDLSRILTALRQIKAMSRDEVFIGRLSKPSRDILFELAEGIDLRIKVIEDQRTGIEHKLREMVVL